MSRHCLLLIAAWFLTPLLSGCAPGSQPPADAFSGELGGCGDFFVYRTSKDRQWQLTVTLNRSALPDREIPDSLDITEDSRAVKVEVLRLSSTSDLDPCDCEAGDPPIERWQAIAGTLTIKTEDVKKPHADENYRVSVQLEGLEVKHLETGARSTLDPVEINRVVVGWFAG
ncbi:MAG: hypothetical protein H8E37_03110 [Planctomycetes bacterium]|nr:hypothetical protein [Planctomycetota bacterium]